MFIKPDNIDEFKVLKTKSKLLEAVLAIDEIGLDAYAHLAARAMTKEERLAFASATTNLSLLWQDEIR